METIAERMGHQKREPFFANRVMRMMTKELVPQNLGTDVFVLVSVIAFQEDAIRYSRPVSFYNPDLQRLCGFKKWDRLDRARKIASQSGWLKWDSPGRGSWKPVWYFVAIPSSLEKVDDSPTEEGYGDKNQQQENTHQKGYSGDSLGDSQGIDEGIPRGYSGGIFKPTPKPVPNPIPKDTPLTPQGDDSDFSLDGSPLKRSRRKHPAPDAPDGPRNADRIRDVISHYRLHHPRSHPNPSPSSREWKLISARLADGYSVADLKQAIDGCHRSPFHCGVNKDNRKYQALELIMRDSSKVSAFMELTHAADGPVLSERSSRSMQARERFLQRYREGQTNG